MLQVHSHWIQPVQPPPSQPHYKLTDAALAPARSNSLTDLPDDLDQLSYLRVVRLKYNQLKRLPAVLLRLPQLMTLELSGNQVGGLRGLTACRVAAAHRSRQHALLAAMGTVLSGDAPWQLCAAQKNPLPPSSELAVG